MGVVECRPGRDPVARAYQAFSALMRAHDAVTLSPVARMLARVPISYPAMMRALLYTVVGYRTA